MSKSSAASIERAFAPRNRVSVPDALSDRRPPLHPPRPSRRARRRARRQRRAHLLGDAPPRRPERRPEHASAWHCPPSAVALNGRSRAAARAWPCPVSTPAGTRQLDVPGRRERIRLPSGERRAPLRAARDAEGFTASRTSTCAHAVFARVVRAGGRRPPRCGSPVAARGRATGYALQRPPARRRPPGSVVPGAHGWRFTLENTGSTTRARRRGARCLRTDVTDGRAARPHAALRGGAPLVREHVRPGSRPDAASPCTAAAGSASPRASASIPRLDRARQREPRSARAAGAGRSRRERGRRRSGVHGLPERGYRLQLSGPARRGRIASRAACSST